jgi:hypothetical protein
MNLQFAYKIIGAAQHEPSGFLVRGREAAHEVHLMAEAGLVKLGESEPTEAVITRITHAGRQFYRALKNVRAYSSN